MLCLTIRAGATVARHAFRDGRLRIGSELDNDVVLASPFVSRHHVVLTLDGVHLEVQDLGSTNGTFVQGQRVTFLRLPIPVTLRIGKEVEAIVGPQDSDDVRLAAVVASPLPPAVTVRTTRPGGDDAARPDAATLLSSLAHHGPEALAALARAAREMSGARTAAVMRLGGPGEGLAILHLAGDVRDLEDIGPGDVTGEAAVTPSLVVARASEAGLVAVIVAPRSAVDVESLADALVVASRQATTASRAPVSTPAPSGSAGPLDPSVLGASFIRPTSAIMSDLHAAMGGALTSDLPILLTGSTGVGKEVYARALHAQSRRAAGPFRAVNASAVPETLLESLLFGVEEGVATGVRRGRGLIREAEGGTFFLDEIGDMPALLQARLLRVIELREVLPVGAAAPVRIDVRFIAATHRDLPGRVADGQFRADLFHRLAGHVFRIPDLREHPEDIPQLVSAALQDECRRSSRWIPGVSVKAMRCLQSHEWPGNVRELENLVRRLVHELPEGRAIGVEDLPAALRGEPQASARSLEAQLDVTRRRVVLEALELTSGNRLEAARRLEISRGTLRALMRRLGIDARHPTNGDDEAAGGEADA